MMFGGGDGGYIPPNPSQQPQQDPTIQVSQEDVFNFINRQTEINIQQAETRTAQEQQLAEILALMKGSSSDDNGHHGNTSASHTNTTNYTPLNDFTPANPVSVGVSPDKLPKARLPKVEPYTDEDRSLYPQYKGLLEAKLDIDGAAIGSTDKERAWFAFGTLKGEAAKRIFPWVSLVKNKEEFSVASLLEQMDQAFSDPQEQAKALKEVNRMKQGKQDLRTYIGNFEQELLKAGGWTWAEEVKKSMLLRGVNREIKAQMVGKEEPGTYTKLVAFIRKISDDLAALNNDNGNWRSFSNNSTGNNNNHAKTRPSNDTMDWEPTSTAAAATRVGNGQSQGRPRAKWVSKQALDRRREEGKCLRCGDANHFIGQCSQGPAKKPVRAAAATTKKPTTLVTTIEELEDKSESENE